MRSFQTTTALALAFTTIAGCNLFKKSSSDVASTNGKMGDQTQQPPVNPSPVQQYPVKECPLVKVLTDADLGVWRMPHTLQGSWVNAENGIDVEQVTVAVVKRAGEAPVVYFANGKMPASLATDQQKIDWLATSKGGRLDVTQKRTLQECGTDSALIWLGGGEVGCFDVDECRIVWIGDHQTKCEISAEKGQFNEEKLINCGQLKMKPNEQPM